MGGRPGRWPDGMDRRPFAGLLWRRHRLHRRWLHHRRRRHQRRSGRTFGSGRVRRRDAPRPPTAANTHQHEDESEHDAGDARRDRTEAHRVAGIGRVPPDRDDEVVSILRLDRHPVVASRFDLDLSLGGARERIVERIGELVVETVELDDGVVAGPHCDLHRRLVVGVSRVLVGCLTVAIDRLERPEMFDVDVERAGVLNHMTVSQPTGARGQVADRFVVAPLGQHEQHRLRRRVPAISTNSPNRTVPRPVRLFAIGASPCRDRVSRARAARRPTRSVRQVVPRRRARIALPQLRRSRRGSRAHPLRRRGVR